MPPSVIVNNKTDSVSTSIDDHLKSDVGTKLKMLNPLTDFDVQPDHKKKPPVPIRRISGRKILNQKSEIETSPVSDKLRKTRSEFISSKSPRLLRKVKSIPSQSEIVSKLSDESEAPIEENVDNVEKLADECVEKPLFVKNLDRSDEYIEDDDNKKLITSKVNDQIDDDKKGIENEETEVEIKSIDIKEVSIPETKLRKNEVEDVKACRSPTQVVVKQPPPSPRYVKRSAFYSDIYNKGSTNVIKSESKFKKPNPNFSASVSGISSPDEFQRSPATRDRMQSLVDLVMWRDVSRSTFVFGAGIFMIISSSYTQDLNISFVSVTSYLGLVYLALIFIFRSILQKGVIHVQNVTVVGEEEAIWVVKLVLPYVNEFLLTLKALFSGDPPTTMKLAVVLFILAKCGSSITIWKMAKLGFIGIFTVPKLVTLYSLQLKAQCKFWIGRFKDAWGTCSHKKVIAGIVFSLLWNLCSVVARIWALFMVVVAFRYYQQLMAGREEDMNGDEPESKQGGRVEERKIEPCIEEKET